MQSSQGPLPHSDPLASEFYHNSNARSWSSSSDSSFIDNVKFHRQLEGYSPTPLVKLPSSILGLSPNKAPSIFLKDESNRLNLPSFKILGASWAVCNAVADLIGFNMSAELDASEQDAGVIPKLRDPAVKYSATLAAAAMSASPELELHGGLHLVAATEGNHGRAVAHMASMLGIAARVFVPASVTTASKALIKGEGSLVEIVVVDGDYDEAVRKALVWCREDPAVTLNPPRSSRLFIQDFLPPTSTTDAETALYGSAGSSFKTQAETALRWIVDGYATLFHEIDEQLASLPATPALRKIDAIIIPCGAGSFAQGGVRYLRSSKRAGDNNAEGSGPIIILVEAASAAGLMHSLKSGQLETFPSNIPSYSGAYSAPASMHTVMAGLDCATPSVLAWPDLRAGVDVVTAVSDEEVLRAMQDIQAITENDDHAAVRLDVGPCGAAPLAALRKLAALPAGGLEQFGVKFGPDSTIVLVSTESGKTYRAGTMQENGVTSEKCTNQHPILVGPLLTAALDESSDS
ncbi:tryptophan synthase beta subunit-like PLP-dependent enzyme [Clavulina sp. PMI_390]|nr:tryptophan synthase beta subunit-like PLP-dependent enzyme [Clavulina sp. PMI_390]